MSAISLQFENGRRNTRRFSALRHTVSPPSRFLVIPWLIYRKAKAQNGGVSQRLVGPHPRAIFREGASPRRRPGHGCIPPLFGQHRWTLALPQFPTTRKEKN